MSEKIVGPDDSVVDLEQMTVTQFLPNGKIVESKIYDIFTFEEWADWEEKYQRGEC